jgi:hypothetical protein
MRIVISRGQLQVKAALKLRKRRLNARRTEGWSAGLLGGSRGLLDDGCAAVAAELVAYGHGTPAALAGAHGHARSRGDRRNGADGRSAGANRAGDACRGRQSRSGVGGCVLGLFATGGFFSPPQAVAHFPTELRELAWAEDQQNDDQNNDQMTWLECAQSHKSMPPRSQCTNSNIGCLLRVAPGCGSDGEVRGDRHAV